MCIDIVESGLGATASNTGAIAIGCNTQASGLYSIALGGGDTGCVASGTRSTVAGYNNDDDGFSDCTLIGSNLRATGSNQTIMGADNINDLPTTKNLSIIGSDNTISNSSGATSATSISVLGSGLNLNNSRTTVEDVIFLGDCSEFPTSSLSTINNTDNYIAAGLNPIQSPSVQATTQYIRIHTKAGMFYLPLFEEVPPVTWSLDPNQTFVNSQQPVYPENNIGTPSSVLSANIGVPRPTNTLFTNLFVSGNPLSFSQTPTGEQPIITYPNGRISHDRNGSVTQGGTSIWRQDSITNKGYEALTPANYPGTVSTVSGSPLITGVNTVFTSFAVGQQVQIDDTIVKVVSITNDTEMVVNYGMPDTSANLNISFPFRYTGTITNVTGTTLQGSNTIFTIQLDVGNTIIVNGVAVVVASIIDDTTITVNIAPPAIPVSAESPIMAVGTAYLGLLSGSSGTNILTGNGTLFTSDMSVYIKISVKDTVYTVTDIISDTELRVNQLLPEDISNEPALFPDLPVIASTVNPVFHLYADGIQLDRSFNQSVDDPYYTSGQIIYRNNVGNQTVMTESIVVGSPYFVYRWETGYVPVFEAQGLAIIEINGTNYPTNPGAQPPVTSSTLRITLNDGQIWKFYMINASNGSPVVLTFNVEPIGTMPTNKLVLSSALTQAIYISACKLETATSQLQQELKDNYIKFADGKDNNQIHNTGQPPRIVSVDHTPYVDEDGELANPTAHESSAPETPRSSYSPDDINDTVCINVGSEESQYDLSSNSFSTRSRISLQWNGQDTVLTYTWFREFGLDPVVLYLNGKNNLVDPSLPQLDIVCENFLGPMTAVSGQDVTSNSSSLTFTYHGHKDFWDGNPWLGNSSLPQTLESTFDAQIIADLSNPITINNSDPYSGGKEIAKYALLALYADLRNLSTERTTALQAIETSLDLWLSESNANPLIYETSYGGLCTQDGINNPSSNFGEGWYNDHHFHWGYWIYAAAVILHLDHAWYMAQIDRLEKVFYYIRDIANPSNNDQYFTTLRHFNFYEGRSNAAGLFQFGDSRNQESSSEAINSYYAVCLFGSALQDVSMLPFFSPYAADGELAFNVGRALCNIEMSTAANYYQFNDLFPHPFGDQVTNALNTGVMWTNKADYSTFFSSREYTIAGIQCIPMTPVGRYFVNVAWATNNQNRLNNLVQSANEEGTFLEQSGKEWVSILLNFVTRYDKVGALSVAMSLSQADMDNGQSKSNLIYTIGTS